MSDRKARLTIIVDPACPPMPSAWWRQGKASSVSAVFNDALSEEERRDRRALDHLKEIADPAKVARMMANVDAQAAQLPTPLRRRVQRAVDRRFNRARYDADQTVAAFAARLKDAVDLDSVRDDLATVVHRTLEPVHVSVWLTSRD